MGMRPRYRRFCDHTFLQKWHNTRGQGGEDENMKFVNVKQPGSLRVEPVH